jgi:signal transduction histidine kinase
VRRRLVSGSAIVVLAAVLAADAADMVTSTYDSVAALLGLDLLAAAGLCFAATWALARGRPLVSATAAGLAAVAVLGDSLVGHSADGSVVQSLGFAAAPLLPPLLALAAAEPSHAARRAALAALCITGAVCAFAACALYDPFTDLACQRTCAANPILVADAPGVLAAARAVEAAAVAAWCLMALRGSRLVALGVALTGARLAASTDDVHRAGPRVLHAAAAIGALLIAAELGRGLRWLPRTRDRLDRLLRDLRVTDEQGLEQCLQTATGDRSLRLAYRHPDRDVHIDASGAPALLDAGLRTEIRRHGQTLAVLTHASTSVDVGAALGPAAALALDNERVAAATRYDVEVLRETSARLVALGDAERRRIERNLHDGAQQGLVAVALALRLAQMRDPSPVVDEALMGLERIAAEVRAVAHGIHPAVLAGEGLGPALRSLAHETGTHVDARLGALRRLPEAIEVTLYAAVREVLGGARAARVQATLDGQWLIATITADGWAGDPTLLPVRDRVRALGGELVVHGAIRVRVSLPLAPSMRLPG